MSRVSVSGVKEPACPAVELYTFFYSRTWCHHEAQAAIDQHSVKVCCGNQVPEIMHNPDMLLQQLLHTSSLVLHLQDR